MTRMKITAQAHPNIALVKYWGKRDEALFLPQTPSLSMTLDKLTATTTVQFDDTLNEDEFSLDGRPATASELARFAAHLDLIRSITKTTARAKVASKNDFPTAAGLASSAAGGAALTAAACWASGLSVSPCELSALARRFSGSACRSVEGGFCQWNKGVLADGSDSFAVQLFDEGHWKDLRMVVTLGSAAQKDVSSRNGMKLSVETSPFFDGWKRQVDADIRDVAEAIAHCDLEKLGVIAETNACRMHAVAQSSCPPIIYMKPVTLDVIDAVKHLRKSGTGAWFTLDAGPNPVVLCQAQDAAHVSDVLRGVPGVSGAIEVGPGNGVCTSENHLF